MQFSLPLLIDGHRTDLRDAIDRMPASGLLGLRIIGFGHGVSAIDMQIRPELTFDGKVVQGGIVGALADYAAVSAATAAMPEGWASATTGFQVHNLEPASGIRLVALGRTIKVSKSGALAASDVFADRNNSMDLVATGLATCRLFAVATRDR